MSFKRLQASFRVPSSLLAIGLALPAAAYAASSTASVEADVIKAAQRFLATQAEREAWVEPVFDVTVVNKPKTLPACSRPVTVTPANTQQRRRMQFVVACPNGWRESFILRAHISAKVAVATAALATGKVVNLYDVALERRDISGLSNVISDLDEVVGQAVKRPLRSGQVVARSALTAPLLVKRGERARIHVSAGGIEVSTVGEVMENGQRGDIVRVRNLSTGKVIHARVTEESTVEPVDMFMSP